MKATATTDEDFAAKAAAYAKATRALYACDGVGVLNGLRDAKATPAEGLEYLRGEVRRLCRFYSLRPVFGATKAALCVKSEPSLAPELDEVTSRLGRDMLLRWRREVFAAPDPISWEELNDLAWALARPSVADIIAGKVPTA